jgi:hypothetical protein
MGAMFSIWVYTVVFWNGHMIERHYYTPNECRAAYLQAVDDMRGSSSVTAFGCKEVEMFPRRALRDVDEFNRYFSQRKDY